MARALVPTKHQLLIRELILQLKRGYLEAAYFRNKFDVDIFQEWQDVWQDYVEEEMLTLDDDRVTLTRKGLLHADGLLPAFFEPEYRGVRYT